MFRSLACGLLLLAANAAAQLSGIQFLDLGASGALSTAAQSLDQERNQFQVVDGIGTPLTILYAGAAPGLIEGVFQINVQLTPGTLMPLKLLSNDPASTEGSLASNTVQIYLREPQ